VFRDSVSPRRRLTPLFSTLGQCEMDLTPTGFSTKGDALGRAPDGRPIYVRGAIPGERVRVEITGQNKSYLSALLVEIIEPSPDRVDAPCEYVAPGCGGCQWQHIHERAHGALKRQMVQEAVERGGMIDFQVQPTIELDPWHFRTTIRTAVQDGKAAFRRFRSHTPIPVDACLVAHPLLADLLTCDYSGAGEVVLRCGVSTGTRLVATDPAHADVGVPSDVRRDYFEEAAAGHIWRVSSDSFFQCRPDGVDALVGLVERAIASAGTPTHAADLYSGVGIFARTLSLKGWSVTSVEGSAGSVADARVNLRDLGVKVVHSDVRSWRAGKVDLVVADPSRDGLGSTVRKISETQARTVVLVSCDLDALTQDLRRLHGAGYELVEATPVDLFGQTVRIETVALLKRRQHL
jgi:tRNA/tmRNA/rRNA uracil-C5-methylase (TrmA/RlmC/RlmD family)